MTRNIAAIKLNLIYAAFMVHSSLFVLPWLTNLQMLLARHMPKEEAGNANWNHIDFIA
jgi:hypothetical protein